MAQALPRAICPYASRAFEELSFDLLQEIYPKEIIRIFGNHKH